MKFKRDIHELQSRASLWWPEELKKENALASILPLLLESQADFLRILTLCKKDPFQLFALLEASKYPANLFLKHIVVLSDFGGEPIQRLGRSFKDIFSKTDDGKYYFDFLWKGISYHYKFKSLPINGLDNKKLFIDGDGLVEALDMNDLYHDMITLLLYASTSEVADQAGLDACMVGSLLGNEKELLSFVKQRYITVSRITGGASANSLGQLAQTEVFKFLRSQLDQNCKITRNGYIGLEGYDKKGGMPFDIVIEKDDAKIGIEVSFQVTTNSTIERKAGQAVDRQTLMHHNGYQIAYVLDGAGNFQRSSALATLCSHSDCTVAYSFKEFEILADWIKQTLN